MFGMGIACISVFCYLSVLSAHEAFTLVHQWIYRFINVSSDLSAQFTDLYMFYDALWFPLNFLYTQFIRSIFMCNTRKTRKERERMSYSK